MPRILVVDDEPHVTRLVQIKLRSAGYSVTTASNGMEALSRLQEEAYDAVVTDYNMPKMNGKQLCEAVRDLYPDPDSPIHLFLVTARLEDQIRVWADDLVNVQYLEKPLSLQELLSRFEKCFSDDQDQDDLEEGQEHD